MSDAVIQKLDKGFAAQQSGDFVAAELHYKDVLELEPDNIHALNLLGIVYLASSRPDQAVDYLSQALAVDADNPQTYTNIGLAYKDLGNKGKAAHYFREATKLDPDAPEAHNNLANVLRDMDEPEDAICSYERALQLDPEFAEYWSNLATALLETYQLKSALHAVDRALQLDPSQARAYKIKGDIYKSEARHLNALSAYTRAIELDPMYAQALVEMARVQRDLDAPDEAMKTLTLALEIDAENPEALLAQGIVHEQLGDRASAIASFQAAIAMSPETTAAHYRLSGIWGRKSSDAEFKAMRQLRDQAELNAQARMYLALGLYRAYEHRHRYDDAFRCLEEGKSLIAEKSPYDDEDLAKRFELIRACTEKVISRLGDCPGRKDGRPVFVLGMPRSGTSLTEQVLASHSKVAGAGERSYVYDTAHYFKYMAGHEFPDNMTLLSAEQYEELGRYYMGRHSAEDLEAQCLIDKTPSNYLYIGLLALALPQAKFIHCHREPVANCFSIYRLPFDKNQSYFHDLVALGKYYTHYSSLMQSWHALFPGRILDVCYEHTVADLEKQSRRMLEFLDLPFEKQVLDFHNTERLVRTPSASQVREPIYKDSIAAWKKYERHLAPLIETLASDSRDCIQNIESEEQNARTVKAPN